MNMAFSWLKSLPLFYLELLLDIFLWVFQQDFCLKQVFYFPEHEYILSVYIKIYNTNNWLL